MTGSKPKETEEQAARRLGLKQWRHMTKDTITAVEIIQSLEAKVAQLQSQLDDATEQRRIACRRIDESSQAYEALRSERDFIMECALNVAAQWAEFRSKLHAMERGAKEAKKMWEARNPGDNGYLPSTGRLHGHGGSKMDP